tara:strand:+ start:689 stop:1627 length:939 start_codon:yes stop_codon:yes gene_type:complete
MSTTFKNGIVSKNGVNQGVNTPPTGTNAPGQNVASGNVPDFLSGGWNKAKDIGQKVFSGIGETAENYMSNLRGKNLPGMPGTELSADGKAFWGYGDLEDRDWRVSLSMPSSFELSTLLEPLTQTGNKMVFPYTPTIILSHSANYNQIQPIHNNYPFFAYNNSQVDQLVITGQFYCQNSIEAQYWISCLHYLRTVTKMNYGVDTSASKGAPPPIVKLNGYGDYIFKEVPVIITQFTVDLPNEVDYVATGFAVPSTGDPEAGGAGSQATPSDVTWAPTESQFTVTCQPVYSRDKVQKFDYNAFIRGENLSDGYI